MRLLPRVLLLLVCLTLGVGVERACAQVSPGALAAPHATLDGATQCFKCHEQGAGRAGMDRRCLACHGEVSAMRTAKRGFHARHAAEACAACHPDHGGRDFALIAWSKGRPEAFDHAEAGFTLQGRHAALRCRDCHQPRYQHGAVVAQVQVRDHARSWLGLEPACASCHDDIHQGGLGRDCASCHDAADWRRVPRFDHARTGWALTGAHGRATCQSCHATPAVNAGPDAKGVLKPLWKPVPHADCVACHKDPHAGHFTGACARCHTTEAWAKVDTKGFDHEQTRYPLRGRHASVRCESCHDARHGGRHPRFAACADCHDDAHAGQATIAGRASDCAVCHDVRGFAVSTWPVAEHQRTRYALDGAHATVACAGCHTRASERSSEASTLGRARVRMRPSHNVCGDCHADPHAGRFTIGGARPHQAGCLACHSMAAFVPSTYDGRAHADCVFPLEGGHRATPCQRCHAELDKPRGHSTLLGSRDLRALPFDSRARACRDCHDDAHGGQFAARRDKGACESCHDFAAFSPATRFDHDRDAAFHLQGAHTRTACAACHRSGRMADGVTRVIWRPTPKDCESCHAPDAPSGGKGRSNGESTPRGSGERMRSSHTGR